MSYTKQTWANGDLITADKLNHMEDGVADATPWVIEMTFVQDGYNSHCESTAKWDDVAAAVKTGRNVVIHVPEVENYGVAEGWGQITGYYAKNNWGYDESFIFLGDGYSFGAFSDLYKSDDGYLCGYVYVD